MATVQKTQGSMTGSRTSKAQTAQVMQGEGPTIEMIAARAYEIWQESGCPQGRDAENWYQAERELRARMK